MKFLSWAVSEKRQSNYPAIRLLILLLICSTLIQCQKADKLPPGDPDNGGLFLPDGFVAIVVADSVGRARHMAVNAEGEIYVKLRVPNPKGIVALKDTTNNGKADIIEVFGNYEDNGNYGTAMRIHNGYLYFSTAGEVYRTKLEPGKLVPSGEVELIVKDDYKNTEYGYEHIAKPIAFDHEGHIYVPFGSPSDVCQEFNRKPGSPGRNPCPELDAHAGIWRFDANKLNQSQEDGFRYATGIRSVVAMDWNQNENTLYVVQHGRDNFSRSWPEMYNAWESALLPSEEFFRVEEGTDGGWPYYYYDQMQGKKLRNPEYGGDKKIEAGDNIQRPIVGFPGHFAPNDLHFYMGNQFPDRYKNGAFVAFHGSTIRAPYPQAGYFVGFVPFENGVPSGPWEVFADGFAALDTIYNTGDAAARPMGLAMGPDGSLYVTESVRGKIWRIMYKGDKSNFGDAQLAGVVARKLSGTNIKDPHIEKDNLEVGILEAGAQIYNLYCGTCHQRDGNGDGTRFPPLAGVEYVTGNKRRLIDILLNGMEGQITVNGVAYNGIMPAHAFLSDEDAAKVLTYIRKSFGNNANAVSPAEIKRFREEEAKN